MAKQAGYSSLATLIEREVLPLAGCSTFSEFEEQFDAKEAIRSVVRGLDYKGTTYYLLIPNKTREERRALLEAHRLTGASPHVEPVPEDTADQGLGVQCDRCIAPARVKAEFSTGPLYACAHHAREFGWWIEAMGGVR